MIPQRLPPPPGWQTLDFWITLVSMICTGILSVIGIPEDVLRNLPGGSTWAPIWVMALIGAILLLRTFLKTRPSAIEKAMPASSEIVVKARPLVETTEFWLGVAAIMFELLQEFSVLGQLLNGSWTTTLLILAIVYALSRSYIKQAYLERLIFTITKSPSSDKDATRRETLVPFTPGDRRR